MNNKHFYVVRHTGTALPQFAALTVLPHKYRAKATNQFFAIPRLRKCVIRARDAR